MPELSSNMTPLESRFKRKHLVLTIQVRHISPFTLYLYLNPLYSSLGGSTTLADPLTNRPSQEKFLNEPL